MDVLTPRTLDEALRLKAERPDAMPIQGGTDVMVELNFDRARPPALLNLNEVPELRGWSRDNGSVRLRAGLTYTEAMEPPLTGLLPALAEAALTVDRERDEVRAAFGSAGPVPGLVRAPLGERDEFAEKVAAAASPLDDVRGSAAYRRHALRILTERALERCLA